MHQAVGGAAVCHGDGGRGDGGQALGVVDVDSAVVGRGHVLEVVPALELVAVALEVVGAGKRQHVGVAHARGAGGLVEDVVLVVLRHVGQLGAGGVGPHDGLVAVLVEHRARLEVQAQRRGVHDHRHDRGAVAGHGDGQGAPHGAGGVEAHARDGGAADAGPVQRAIAGGACRADDVVDRRGRAHELVAAPVDGLQRALVRGGGHLRGVVRVGDRVGLVGDAGRGGGQPQGQVAVAVDLVVVDLERGVALGRPHGVQAHHGVGVHRGGHHVELVGVVAREVLAHVDAAVDGVGAGLVGGVLRGAALGGVHVLVGAVVEGDLRLVVPAHQVIAVAVELVGAGQVVLLVGHELHGALEVGVERHGAAAVHAARREHERVDVGLPHGVQRGVDQAHGEGVADHVDLAGHLQVGVDGVGVAGLGGGDVDARGAAVQAPGLLGGPAHERVARAGDLRDPVVGTDVEALLGVDRVELLGVRRGERRGRAVDGVGIRCGVPHGVLAALEGELQRPGLVVELEHERVDAVVGAGAHVLHGDGVVARILVGEVGAVGEDVVALERRVEDVGLAYRVVLGDGVGVVDVVDGGAHLVGHAVQRVGAGRVDDDLLEVAVAVLAVVLDGVGHGVLRAPHGVELDVAGGHDDVAAVLGEQAGQAVGEARRHDGQVVVGVLGGAPARQAVGVATGHVGDGVADEAARVALGGGHLVGGAVVEVLLEGGPADEVVAAAAQVAVEGAGVLLGEEVGHAHVVGVDVRATGPLASAGVVADLVHDRVAMLVDGVGSVVELEHQAAVGGHRAGVGGGGAATGDEHRGAVGQRDGRGDDALVGVAGHGGVLGQVAVAVGGRGVRRVEGVDPVLVDVDGLAGHAVQRLGGQLHLVAGVLVGAGDLVALDGVGRVVVGLPDGPQVQVAGGHDHGVAVLGVEHGAEDAAGDVAGVVDRLEVVAQAMREDRVHVARAVGVAHGLAAGGRVEDEPVVLLVVGQVVVGDGHALRAAGGGTVGLGRPAHELVAVAERVGVVVVVAVGAVEQRVAQQVVGQRHGGLLGAVDAAHVAAIRRDGPAGGGKRVGVVGALGGVGVQVQHELVLVGLVVEVERRAAGGVEARGEQRLGGGEPVGGVGAVVAGVGLALVAVGVAGHGLVVGVPVVVAGQALGHALLVGVAVDGGVDVALVGVGAHQDAVAVAVDLVDVDVVVDLDVVVLATCVVEDVDGGGAVGVDHGALVAEAVGARGVEHTADEHGAVRAARDVAVAEPEELVGVGGHERGVDVAVAVDVGLGVMRHRVAVLGHGEGQAGVLDGGERVGLGDGAVAVAVDLDVDDGDVGRQGLPDGLEHAVAIPQEVLGVEGAVSLDVEDGAAGHVGPALELVAGLLDLAGGQRGVAVVVVDGAIHVLGRRAVVLGDLATQALVGDGELVNHVVQAQHQGVGRGVVAHVAGDAAGGVGGVQHRRRGVLGQDPREGRVVGEAHVVAVDVQVAPAGLGTCAGVGDPGGEHRVVDGVEDGGAVGVNGGVDAHVLAGGAVVGVTVDEVGALQVAVGVDVDGVALDVELRAVGDGLEVHGEDRLQDAGGIGVVAGGVEVGRVPLGDAIGQKRAGLAVDAVAGRDDDALQVGVHLGDVVAVALGGQQARGARSARVVEVVARDARAHVGGDGLDGAVAVDDLDDDLVLGVDGAPDGVQRHGVVGHLEGERVAGLDDAARVGVDELVGDDALEVAGDGAVVGMRRVGRREGAVVGDVPAV